MHVRSSSKGKRRVVGWEGKKKMMRAAEASYMRTLNGEGAIFTDPAKPPWGLKGKGRRQPMISHIVRKKQDEEGMA